MNHLSRRHFLQSSALSLAAGPLLAEEKKLSANDKLHVGVIGVAGRGEGNWRDLIKCDGAEIVAGSDVDDSVTGKFKLTIGLRKSTNLAAVPFSDFPMNGAGMTSVINAQGQLEFVFPVSDNAAFFRVQAQ